VEKPIHSIAATASPAAAVVESSSGHLSDKPESAVPAIDEPLYDELPSGGAEAAEADDDLIFVEDDPHPTIARPSPVVRRQEYRQLFARLRRGD
jgi:hypothetical protein